MTKGPQLRAFALDLPNPKQNELPLLSSTHDDVSVSILNNFFDLGASYERKEKMSESVSESANRFVWREGDVTITKASQSVNE